MWVFAHLWGSTRGPAGTWATSPQSVDAPSSSSRWSRWRVRRWASCCGTPPPSSASRSGGPSLGEGILGNNIRSAQPWLLSTNITGWLQHGTSYLVDRCASSDGGYSCETIQQPLSFAHSATYLGVLVVALVLVIALVFRRRDVR